MTRARDTHAHTHRRVLALEVRNEDNERSLSDAKRACERQEQRAELAERAVRGLELQVVDADRYKMGIGWPSGHS
eukprot:scaffold203076_cov12-Tisochrysis_lutea.AAC.1